MFLKCQLHSWWEGNLDSNLGLSDSKGSASYINFNISSFIFTGQVASVAAWHGA